jgi:hypothetical protein
MQHVKWLKDRGFEITGITRTNKIIGKGNTPPPIENYINQNRETIIKEWAWYHFKRELKTWQSEYPLTVVTNEETQLHLPVAKLLTLPETITYPIEIQENNITIWEIYNVGNLYDKWTSYWSTRLEETYPQSENYSWHIYFDALAIVKTERFRGLTEPYIKIYQWINKSVTQYSADSLRIKFLREWFKYHDEYNKTPKQELIQSNEDTICYTTKAQELLKQKHTAAWALLVLEQALAKSLDIDTTNWDRLLPVQTNTPQA